MPYIQVDVSLDDIDTDDLADELADRLRRGLRTARDKQKMDELKILLADCEKLCNTGVYVPNSLPIKSLEDKMKIEHLQEVWNKYSLSQIQSALA